MPAGNHGSCITMIPCLMKGAVASWLVHLSPDKEGLVWVGALPRDNLLCFRARRFTQGLSPGPGE